MANPYEDLIGEDNPYGDLVTGEIPNTENFLQKAIRNSRKLGPLEGIGDSASFGASSMARGLGDMAANKVFESIIPNETIEIPEREITPGYVLGGAIPALAGAGYIGKKTIGSVFKRQIAKAKLPGASEKLSESIQKVIKRSKADPDNLGVDKNQLIKMIEDQYLKSTNPAGREATVFRTWLKTLKGSEKAPSKVSDKITADILSEMEQQFGKASAFSTKPSNPILAKGAKEIRNSISKQLDDVARKSGVPEFITRSSEKSTNLKNLKADPSLLEAIFPAVRRVKNVIGDRAKGVLKYF